ncbi:hypothetical protein F751_2247 [Auxenochlorella protothecoides]|uniref:Uncharacterized protein n=1 Tax=Auxenochlorella protothecoides TaxID=3075 RepID=A0A087SMN7_AUXPR|nr:hypothetical protein F751_2247 [Auxenochlorella protothecoides]KFM26991.1 hypothetical protein F751_2247 [Auxenochlorella protothecoides]
MPSVSGGVSTPTSATAAGGEVVSASLEGLVHALDGLKTSLGYDDFATVQSLIGDLRAENLELRSYAETAIREAQKLKEAHDALAEQLAERALEDRVGRAVAETNRLASLADDFDRELAPGRGEEVERAKREAEALRARVGDLEAERADLERRLAAAERRAQEAERRAQEAERRAQDAAASAARTTSIRLAELALQNEDLRREVASLSETMFGKTFRPPSAWAEREARLSAVLQERDALRGQLAASVAVVGEATVGAAAAGAAAGGVGPMADESGAGPATSAASVDADARASPRRDAEADAALARSEARLAELHARLEAAEAARRAALAALRAARGGGVKGAAGEGVTQGGAAAGGELAAAEEAGEREPAADPAAEPAAELEAELVRAQEELAGEGVDGPRAEELASRRDGLVARLVGAPAGGAPASSREDEVEPGGATEDGDVATQRLLSALVARAGLQAALAVAEAEAAQLKTGVRPGSGGRGTPRSSPHAAMAQDEGGAASQGSQAHPAQPGAAHQDGAGGAQVAGTLAGTAAQTAAQTVIPQAGGFASASVSRTTTAEQAVSPALAAADRGGAAAPLPAGPASPTGSAASEAARALAADRAAADAAWEDYAASSDLPALKRARAELEARCALLEAQIGKMAGELEEADQDKAEIEARVDAAVRTGDVTPLKEPTPKRTPGAKTGGGKSQGGRAQEELRAVRAENQMIMEHLVMTKIRMAEMEGDYLESKRALLRAREKQLELTKKLTAVQAAAPALLAPARSTTSAGPLSAAAAGSPPGPQASEVGESGGATPEPATAPSPSPRDSGRSGGSRGLRIPGLA